MTFCSNSVRFGLPPCYGEHVRVRCFLCKYGDGSELLRWFQDDGQPWAQQVFKQRLPDGPLEHTGGDRSAVFFLEGFKQLIEAGKAVEL